MITVKQENSYATIKFHTFSGGEEHVNISFNTPGLFRFSSPAVISARIDSSSELMRLLLVTDALKRMGMKELELRLPYIPYARQDRVCAEGDAFSLKVFANLINAQGYKRIYISDAHSSVATALLENVYEFPQEYFASCVEAKAIESNIKFDYIVAPDAGASKKAILFSRKWVSDIDVIQALKIRETSTGDITKTTVLHEDLAGKNCLIVDDICDGGRTFTELAKVLQEKGANEIGLFVTHGIFSKGLDPLFEQRINYIFTTDSFEQRDSRAKIIYNFF